MSKHKLFFKKINSMDVKQYWLNNMFCKCNIRHKAQIISNDIQVFKVENKSIPPGPEPALTL